MLRHGLFLMLITLSLIAGCSSPVDTGTGTRVPAGFPADHPESGM